MIEVLDTTLEDANIKCDLIRLQTKVGSPAELWGQWFK
jgi:hypothetical protein